MIASRIPGPVFWINDTYGHQAGDEYIIKAGRMICDIFQHSPVFRTGGDEFVAVLTGRDYIIRKELLLALHDRSVEHINSQDVVVSGGLSDYIRGEEEDFHDVFERADALIYEEKQLLKGMGAIGRGDEEEVRPVFAMDESADILRIKRQILMVTDCYLEFYTGKDGKLEIRPGGTDFFGAAREKLLEDVIEDVAERVREATGKAGLMRWMDQEEAVTLSFHKMKAGMPVHYALQTIKTRESDVHHTVIGIRRVS